MRRTVFIEKRFEQTTIRNYSGELKFAGNSKYIPTVVQWGYILNKVQ